MKNKIYNIFPILLLLISSFKIQAQCTASVPGISGGSATTFAIKTAQSFTPTCNGQLNTIVFNFNNPFADDLRGSGYFIKCNLKSAMGTLIATGIWPGGSTTTDNVFPGQNLSADFTCDNITLISGTQYIWELQCNDLIELILFSYTATSTYAGGAYIKDGVVQTNNDVQGWTVNLGSGTLATANSTKTQNVSTCNTFYNAAAQLIAKVVPGTTNGIAGNTTAKVWLETTQPAQFVKRHYEITPAANATTATGTVTLYFTQQEFTDFNAVNTLKLPTGAADVTGIANLQIEKRPGVSSDGSGLPNTYTGTAVTIDPVDANIVWNSALSRWGVTFAVTGFSGFFVKTISGTLPLNWLSISGNLNTNKQATLRWQVQENNVSSYSIEKSNNGRTFNSIAMLNSKGDGVNAYNFTDATALNGVSYYRIKQVDRDGRNSYSTIIKLSNNQISILQVYPNPVKDIVSISGATIGSKAILADVSGKQLQQIIITQSAFTIDMSKYNSGIYLLKTDGVVQKIIKE